jgi:hypothetical protein
MGVWRWVMPSLAFNLSLFFTFPGFVSRDLPFVFGFPSLGLSLESQNRITASFDVGGISYTLGGERIALLNSSLGFGTNINNFDLTFGFTGTTAGISRLNIEDQNYTATFLRVGYRLGNFRVGLNLPVYLLAGEKKLSLLPVPLLYVSISSKK